MKRILAVCDDRDMLESLSVFLKTRGYDADIAFGRDEAIRKLKEKHYDLLILDYLMRPVNGVDTLMDIRKDPKISSIKTIMATAVPRDEIGEETLKKLKVLEYVQKPVDLHEFEKVIRKVLGE